MMDPGLMALISDNEQEQMLADKWWNETSDEEKNKVFQAIIAMPDAGVEGVISRLAQKAMCDLAERHARIEG